MKKLSVVLATYNEEKNIADCLKSVHQLADEVVIVDGGSVDKTVEIAKSLGAKVIVTENPLIFHINKQKALEAASNEWILQLDADEMVSSKLAEEIKKMINMDDEEIEKYQQNLPKRKLFLRHQNLVEKRDVIIGNNEESYAAFFIPRLNYFLGKYLKYGGVYPDGVIRLVRRGKAKFPCKSVHEQIEVEGKVGWLKNELLHNADPTFKRYLERNNRYINLIADELRKSEKGKNIFQFIKYMIIMPIWWFFITQIRHKGVLDGMQGVIFSIFSALRFPRAYWRYLISR